MLSRQLENTPIAIDKEGLSYYLIGLFKDVHNGFIYLEKIAAIAMDESGEYTVSEVAEMKKLSNDGIMGFNMNNIVTIVTELKPELIDVYTKEVLNA